LIGVGAGVYQLLLWLEQEQTVRIGAVGTFLFPSGWYVYVGSARSGLRSRIARHLSATKSLRWHIDYLRQVAEPRWAHTITTPDLIECECARALTAAAGAEVVAPRFGASDCRCPAHLLRLTHGEGPAAVIAVLQGVIEAAPDRRRAELWSADTFRAAQGPRRGSPH
jgi:Uri superfamily endonuclease